MPRALPEAKIVTRRQAPEWEKVLTASLKENSLAPAEEVILLAFDLYCDELNAPFDQRRQVMAKHFSKIAALFAQVQSLAPDMVERAAAKHRLELDRFIEKKGEF
ncbi:hypothetical protein BAR1_09165 [Profundibacter amoris]|uniref:Uncharacterized protein n=2 Tax=Profundibacter amoris TaxID=2171755 RepID=A0A347UGV8_9RHOB|nr:hypothetical protein BAR1_09165 [Profundibacter amoris]